MKILDVPRSGSYQGITSSRNRNGQYVRTRAMPVQPRSEAQLTQRARQSANSAAWRDLTQLQRDGWTSLGGSIQRTDQLGQSYTLTGFQAYVSVNNIRALQSLAAVAAAPAMETPEAVASVTLTLTGGGSPAFSVAFTPTPAGADTMVVIRASPQRSAGRTFEGDFRVMAVGAANGASPTNLLTAYQARFGSPVTGNKIFVQVSTARLGFESSPFLTSEIAG